VNEELEHASVTAERPLPFSGYVVGIGASAGGLEALELFFDHCPAHSGAVFVVIQHLSPDHKSMMSNLLARHTEMPVTMIENDMPVVSDHVYLIPPGAIMRIEDGHLKLTPKSPHGLTLPIDIFFNSLAEAYGSRAVGIVLSGTGSDGTRGAMTINAAGGFLLAQDPLLAKFDGMPRSVIATGVVDEVMPAQLLAGRMLSHIQDLPYETLRESETPIARATMLADDAMIAILQLLLQVGGIDFHDYKPATIARRIERRMQVRHIVTLDEYCALLEHERAEVFVLRRELLIAVTSFFRDTEAFEIVAEQAVRVIVANTGPGETIRVWVAATSTGEEAYSLAMLFFEAFERERRWPNLKIFATDVNQQNIEVASLGQYPESAAAELTPERLERFFTRKDGQFVVKAELRQSIVFARHNLLADPPFTRMDLVSCRNALIYFRTEAQERALRRLQYAIKPERFLFLGSSETLAGTSSGFTALSGKHKLFVRTGNSQPLLFNTSGARGSSLLPSSRASKTTAPKARQPFDLAIKGGLATLVDAFVPPSILVNDRHEAVHLFGNMQPYIRMREGTASLELNRILPDRLVPIASALLYKAGKDQETLVSNSVPVDAEIDANIDDSEPRRVLRLSARPIVLAGDERFMLLSFQENADLDPSNRPGKFDVDAETMARITMLERELAATRESLQATIEELETSNEELQATNEELMSSNEELQSSNEELQSVNEEINTVNAEYQEKVVILNHVNADLDSMAKAVGVATVFVDHQMHLTRFSPDATSIFKLRAFDIGRPLDEIAHTLKYPGLTNDLRRTMRSREMVEQEVMSSDGKLYLVRILPYSATDDSQRGAVATFVDVTVFRDLQRLQAIIDALPEHIAVLEHDGTISMVNDAWSSFARANGDVDLHHSGPGANYFGACRLGADEDGITADRALRGVRSVLEGNLARFTLEYPCHSPSEQRWFVMNVAPVSGHEFAAVVSHVNISIWYQNEKQREAHDEQS